MKNVLTYNEFINEDYRDVVGCGSGGRHQGDSITQLGNGGSNTIIDVIGYPSGDKQMLGTVDMTVKGNEYWDSRKKKVRKVKDVEEILKKRMRTKAFNNFQDVDKKSKNI